MDTKFTSGPWVVNDGYYSKFLQGKITTKFDGHDVVLCDTPSLIFGESESTANAHLIACAPDMYEMLGALKEDYPLSHPVSMGIEQLLKRARGE